MAVIGGVSTASGIDFDQLTALSGRSTSPRAARSAPQRRHHRHLVRRAEATKRVGGTVRMLNRDWRVCGIVQSGRLARLFVLWPRCRTPPITTAR